MAELGLLQQMSDSLVTLARESLFTGVASYPLALVTSGPELMRLLDLLLSMEVRTDRREIEDKRYLMKNGEWCSRRR